MTLVEKWGGWDRNVADSPEKCGMEMIATLDDRDASYSFDTVIVVRDLETRKLYAAHDSGCSCPTPFEDVTGLGDMTEIRSVADIQAFVKANDDDYKAWHFDDRQAMYRAVQSALKAQA